MEAVICTAGHDATVRGRNKAHYKLEMKGRHVMRCRKILQKWRGAQSDGRIPTVNTNKPANTCCNRSLNTTGEVRTNRWNSHIYLVPEADVGTTHCWGITAGALEAQDIGEASTSASHTSHKTHFRFLIPSAETLGVSQRNKKKKRNDTADLCTSVWTPSLVPLCRWWSCTSIPVCFAVSSWGGFASWVSPLCTELSSSSSTGTVDSNHLDQRSYEKWHFLSPISYMILSLLLAPSLPIFWSPCLLSSNSSLLPWLFTFILPHPLSMLFCCLSFSSNYLLHPLISSPFFLAPFPLLSRPLICFLPLSSHPSSLLQILTCPLSQL